MASGESKMATGIKVEVTVPIHHDSMTLEWWRTSLPVLIEAVQSATNAPGDAAVSIQRAERVSTGGFMTSEDDQNASLRRPHELRLGWFLEAEPTP